MNILWGQSARMDKQTDSLGSEKIKVLLVDDSKVVMEIYKEALSDLLYEKKYAKNGHDALALYKAWKPDLILLDILLPVITGFTVLKEIRKIEKDTGGRTAIVMVTSLADINDIRDCTHLGIQGYIVKPFRPPDLALKIEKYYAAHIKNG